MELRNILVNLDIDFYTPGLLDAAQALAERFGARLSAVAAATPAAELIAVEGAALAVGVYEAERAEARAEGAGLDPGDGGHAATGAATGGGGGRGGGAGGKGLRHR